MYCSEHIYIMVESVLFYELEARSLWRDPFKMAAIPACWEQPRTQIVAAHLKQGAL